jgi:hypothetical protein
MQHNQNRVQQFVGYIGSFKTFKSFNRFAPFKSLNTRAASTDSKAPRLAINLGGAGRNLDGK